MENVKNLLSSKHKEHFDLWCEYLESKGYKNFYKVMDSSDYGIAQHRERVFMISILGDYRYEFPKEIPLDNCMKDYLDEVVEDKYYITSEKARTLIDKLILDGKILAEQSRAEQSRAEQSRAIELSIKPKQIDTANCIMASENRGISRISGQGTGVVEITELS